MEGGSEVLNRNTGASGKMRNLPGFNEPTTLDEVAGRPVVSIMRGNSVFDFDVYINYLNGEEFFGDFTQVVQENPSWS
jgi:hypothetical protein